MHGRTFFWLALGLAAAISCSVANAQGIAPAFDPAYQAMGSPMPNTQATDAQLVNFSADDSGLAERVEELEAALKKIKDKDAKTKKKAAGKMSVTAGGRIMWDWETFDQNNVSIARDGDFLNGTEPRRVRVFLKGKGFDVIQYKLQLDFAGGDAAFKDVYFQINELPYLGHVRVGQFYEPWGLETQTSSNYITFMERSTINELGNIGGRKTGVMAHDYDACERMTWWLGAFVSRENSDPPVFPFDDFDDNGGTAIDGRITFLPWYDEATNGRGLFHVGAAYTYRDIASVTNNATDRVRFRARPDLHLAGHMADTDQIQDCDEINAAALEAAMVYGPFSIQAEYAKYWLKRTGNANPEFDGGYIYASWFLTGENRVYKRTDGVFSRVKPFENFFRVRAEDGCIYTGKGAWELGYRASYLNLSDAGIRGGVLTTHTFGVNWYLNPYTRFMVNYVHARSHDKGAAYAPGVDGTCDGFGVRAQIDF